MFLRDGVLWFFCALVSLIVQMTVIGLSPSNIAIDTSGLPGSWLLGIAHLYVPGPIVVVAYSIVSSRVLIGMRALEAKPDETLPSRQLTTIAFQSVAQPEESIRSSDV